MANGVERKKKRGVGAEFPRLKLTAKRKPLGVAPALPVTEDTMAAIKKVASLVASAKGGATPLPEAPAGPKVDLPAAPDVRAGRRETISRGVEATVGGEAGDPLTGFRGGRIAEVAGETGRPSLQQRGVTEPATGFTGEKIRQVASETGRSSIQAPAPAAESRATGVRGPFPTAVIPKTTQAAEPVTRVVEPEVSTLKKVGPLAPGSTGVRETPQPATREEVDTAIEKREAKEPGFFEGLGKEGQNALIEAALTAGTSILESADPFGAFTQISRGVLEGAKAFKGIKAAGAKGRAEGRKEKRVEAGETRDEARLKIAQEELELKKKERGLKAGEEAELRRLKEEADIRKQGREEGKSVSEILEDIDVGRTLQEVSERKGVVESPGTPARTEGGIFGIGGTDIPKTEPIIRFPKTAKKSVTDIRRGVEAGRKTAAPAPNKAAWLQDAQRRNPSVNAERLERAFNARFGG